jgi:hypothetical protein
LAHSDLFHYSAAETLFVQLTFLFPGNFSVVVDFYYPSDSLFARYFFSDSPFSVASYLPLHPFSSLPVINMI